MAASQNLCLTVRGLAGENEIICMSLVPSIKEENKLDVYDLQFIQEQNDKVEGNYLQLVNLIIFFMDEETFDENIYISHHSTHYYNITNQ